MISGQSLGPTTFEQQNEVDPTFPVLASANTIAPVSRFTRLTGNTTVKTITQPTPYFNGPLYFVNTDASVGTWDATGNIAVAGTFTRYGLFMFAFDVASGKWYPNPLS